jgi:transcriptional regulator with XRE-family HTH domain
MAKENKNKQLGDKLRSLREEKNKSQEQISDELNLSQSACSKLENGSQMWTIDHLYKIAEYFGIPAGVFLDADVDTLRIYKQNQDIEQTKETLLSQLQGQLSSISTYMEISNEFNKLLPELIKNKKLRDKSRQILQEKNSETKQENSAIKKSIHDHEKLLARSDLAKNTEIWSSFIEEVDHNINEVDAEEEPEKAELFALLRSCLEIRLMITQIFIRMDFLTLPFNPFHSPNVNQPESITPEQYIEKLTAYRFLDYPAAQYRFSLSPEIVEQKMQGEVDTLQALATQVKALQQTIEQVLPKAEKLYQDFKNFEHTKPKVNKYKVKIIQKIDEALKQVWQEMIKKAENDTKKEADENNKSEDEKQ